MEKFGLLDIVKFLTSTATDKKEDFEVEKTPPQSPQNFSTENEKPNAYLDLMQKHNSMSGRIPKK